MKRETLDLGDGHTLVWISYMTHKRAGCDILHKTPDGHKCSCWVAFEGRAWARRFGTVASWTVECDEPITIAPNIRCKLCGDNGYVRNGKWERIHADA